MSDPSALLWIKVEMQQPTTELGLGEGMFAFKTNICLLLVRSRDTWTQEPD